jgi:hypothetical protein
VPPLALAVKHDHCQPHDEMYHAHPHAELVKAAGGGLAYQVFHLTGHTFATFSS